MVYTWASNGLLYHDFGAYVYTVVVLGPFGSLKIGAKEQGASDPSPGWRSGLLEPKTACSHTQIPDPRSSKSLQLRKDS